MDARALDGKLDAKIGDARVFTVGGGVTAGVGGSTSLSIVNIKNGEDKGWHAYVNTDMNIGVDASLSVSEGVVFGKEPLNKYSFEGKSQGVSIGAGVMTAGETTAYKDGKYHFNPFTSAEVLYKGISIGLSGGPTNLQASATLNFSNSKLIQSNAIEFTKP